MPHPKRVKPRSRTRPSRDKYALYEFAVQSPDVHIEWFNSIYRDLHGRMPASLREDFCGTFKITCEWVKQHESHTGLGLDLDPEPLAYGKARYLPALTPDERSRIRILKRDVRSVTEKCDVIAACNFSFYIFKRRDELLEYFKASLKSLNRQGALILEMAGGPGMITKLKEQRTLKSDATGKFTYVWEQRTFDPITHDSFYAIHFRFPDGSEMKDAFTYDWRLWIIPEVRDALLEAGFDDCRVFWETTWRGEGTGNYKQAERGTNDHSWICYVVGMKGR